MTVSDERVSVTSDADTLSKIDKIVAVLPTSEKITGNYTGSVPLQAIDKNGTLDKSLLQLGSVKGGPNRSRQNTPHAHCAIFAPDNYILTTDFSGDRILCFSYHACYKRNKEYGRH